MFSRERKNGEKSNLRRSRNMRDRERKERKRTNQTSFVTITDEQQTIVTYRFFLLLFMR